MSQAQVLDQKLRSQVQTERKITHEILLTIQAIDITQCFRELGYSSLFSYLTLRVGYSEGATNRRISAARLLKQCPEVANKIQEGKINLSQIALAQAAIKQEEKKSRVKISVEQKQEVLASLEGKNHLETQKALLATFPEFEVPKAKVVAAKGKKVQVNLEFSEEEWAKVKGLLEHMSHKVPDQRLESALLYWAEQIEKKREGSFEKKDGKKSEVPKEISCDMVTADTAVGSRNRRKYISVKTKRHIFQKAQHQCEYVSPQTGVRCNSKSYLDAEHTTPLALGGTDELENLRVMCRSHNHLLAREKHIW